MDTYSIPPKHVGGLQWLGSQEQWWQGAPKQRSHLGESGSKPLLIIVIKYDALIHFDCTQFSRIPRYSS